MYIADYCNHNIFAVNIETKAIRVFAFNPAMNQPNDLVITDEGVLFASDPNWSKSTEQLWRIDKNGSTHLLETNMGTTNGIEVSPDEKKLYVNETVQRKYHLFRWQLINNVRVLVSICCRKVLNLQQKRDIGELLLREIINIINALDLLHQLNSVSMRPRKNFRLLWKT